MTVDELRRLCADRGIRVTTRGTIHARHVAKILRRDLSTLRRWERAGIGPLREGVWYRLDALAEWLASESCPLYARSRASAPLSARALRTHAHTRPAEHCSLRRRSAHAA